MDDLPLFNKTNFNNINVSKSEIETPKLQVTPSVNPLSEIEKSLDSIFPEDYQQAKISKARRSMGNLGESYTDTQVSNLITDFEYLASEWLDLFEKRIFNGKTLKEVLGESKTSNE